MDVVHEVQGQERELHDEVRVVDARPLPFPGPLVTEVPKVDDVSATSPETPSSWFSRQLDLV